jgi:hypothetical protein
MKSCKDCSRYQWCVTLCPPLRNSLSRIERKQKELPIGIPHRGPGVFSLDLHPAPILLTESQKSLAVMLSKGIDRNKIAEMLGINNGILNQQIYRLKQKYYKNPDSSPK